MVTTLQVQLIEDCFATLAPRANALTTRFYQKLFSDYPAVEPMFAGTTPERQAKHLAQALGFAVANLRKPDRLLPTLRGLGKRHAGYGAESAHYDAVGDTLLAVLEEFSGDVWTPHLDEAWAAAYQLIATTMLSAGAAETFTMTEATTTTTTTVSHFPVPAFQVDAAGNILAWNEAVAELTGLDAGEVIGKRAYRAFGDKRRSTPVTDALESASRCEGEVELRDSRGQIRKVQVAVQPQLDAEGEPVGAVVVVSPVTSGAESGSSLESAIRTAGTAMVTIDKTFTVGFANKATFDLLEEHLETFRGAFPGFDPSKLVGTCIDSFHKNPQRIRDLLNDRRNLPHRADIRVGERIFEMFVSGIPGRDEELIGHSLEWKDVTKARRDATEAARMQSLIHSVQSYFMIVDNDLKITYANPSLLEMFRRYEATLREAFPGFSVDRIIGVCIDSFHKNPAHQRKLLGDGSQLPTTKEIKVAGLEFGITACALIDADGKRLGSAVEWLDYNDRAHYRDEVAKVYQACQQGHLQVRGECSHLSPAFAPMMRNINEILDVTLAPIRVLREHLGKVAAGDLTASIKQEFAGDHGLLKQSLNETLSSLNHALGEVSQVAENVASGSREVSDTAQALSSGATQQASSLKEITTTMSLITDQTKRNAENAAVANQLSTEARDVAVKGDAMMKNMVGAMSEINESSQSIRNIIKVIDEIAFQTNLLALNAAVEAARAGVHGKGFAVVAEEVRSLAARSAKAAKETTDMIESSLKKVDQGTDIASQTALALTQIVERVGKVTQLVGEIASASTEQAHGIADINEGVSQVEMVTQTNTASAEESAAASQELSRQAGELNSRLERFTLARSVPTPAGLEGLPPDILAAIQELLSSRSANDGPGMARVRPAAGFAVGSSRGSGQDPAQLIPLDDVEFGKY